jgi:hypothetical protein
MRAASRVVRQLICGKGMKGAMGGYAKDAAQELWVGISRKECGEVFNDTNAIPVILYVIDSVPWRDIAALQHPRIGPRTGGGIKHLDALAITDAGGEGDAGSARSR